MNLSRRISLASFLLLMVGACAVHGQEAGSFEIGPVSIGMAKKDVVRLLGPPDRTVAAEGYFREILTFRLVTVKLDRELTVTSVLSTSEKFCLNGKVCPGMDWDDALLATKSMETHPSSQDQIILMGDGCHAEVLRDKVSVKSVAFDCPP